MQKTRGPEELPKLATPRDIADVLHTSPSMIYRALADGRLRGVRIGRRSVRVDVASVFELLRQTAARG
jgi:excisionase family DNA binding protein